MHLLVIVYLGFSCFFRYFSVFKNDFWDSRRSCSYCLQFWYLGNFATRMNLKLERVFGHEVPLAKVLSKKTLSLLKSMGKLEKLCLFNELGFKHMFEIFEQKRHKLVARVELCKFSPVFFS